MSYQPRWVDGKEVGTGERDCNLRYLAIANELQGHSKFRTLDLGAYNGYFSLRLAEDFDSTVVAIDDWPVLPWSVSYNKLVAPINQRVTAQQIKTLGEFDVVLCLSVLHHFPEWKDTLSVLIGNSRVIFIETPLPEEVLPAAKAHTAELYETVNALPGKVIAHTAGYKSNHQRPLKMVGGIEQLQLWDLLDIPAQK